PAAHAPAQCRARARGRGPSASRRVREPEPRFDDVAAASKRGRVARIGRCGDRGRPRARVAVSARGVPERAAPGGHGSGPLVAGARRALWAEERLGDALCTGLRLTDGVNLDAIGVRYGVDIWSRYGRDLERFIEIGLLRRDRARIWLTRQGMLLAHEVMAIFV